MFLKARLKSGGRLFTIYSILVLCNGLQLLAPIVCCARLFSNGETPVSSRVCGFDSHRPLTTEQQTVVVVTVLPREFSVLRFAGDGWVVI